VGLTVLVIGMQNGLRTRNVLILLGSILIGGLIGELLRIEYHLENLGDYLQRRLAGSGRGASTFSTAFVTSSIIFCVGPLTILGSIRDGLGGPDHAQLLFVKAALDGLVALVFASTLGWGVGFSVVTIVVVQGSLTLAAGAADRVLTARMVDEMTSTGGVMILGIGLRLLDLKRVPVASFLPALVVAPVAVALFAR
jgi:uncharacterized membrane protein YqgA involved in biofilm formation